MSLLRHSVVPTMNDDVFSPALRYFTRGGPGQHVHGRSHMTQTGAEHDPTHVLLRALSNTL